MPNIDNVERQPHSICGEAHNAVLTGSLCTYITWRGGKKDAAQNACKCRALKMSVLGADRGSLCGTFLVAKSTVGCCLDSKIGLHTIQHNMTRYS